MAKEWHKYVVEFVLRKLNLQKIKKKKVIKYYIPLHCARKCSDIFQPFFQAIMKILFTPLSSESEGVK